MTERKLESKSSTELFGDVGGAFGEAHGINRFIKVAPDIGSIEERVISKGLKMLDMPPFDNPEKMWVIYEEGQTLGESLPFFSFEDGIWVSDGDLKRFGELLGLKDELR